MDIKVEFDRSVLADQCKVVYGMEICLSVSD